MGGRRTPIAPGLIRIPDESCPRRRAGYWCKLKDLKQNTDIDGLLVELITLEPDKDGIVQVQNADDKYWVKPTNLVPVEGEKVARCVSRYRRPLRPFARRVDLCSCPSLRAFAHRPTLPPLPSAVCLCSHLHDFHSGVAKGLSWR